MAIDKNKKSLSGILMIEILLAIAIMGTVLASLLSLVGFALINTSLIKQAIQANALAQEEMEAVRNFRDGTSWNVAGLGTLTTMVFYHPEKSQDSPPQWRMILGEETIGIFTRKIIFHGVLRDGDDNIVASGGTNDSETRKVSAFVSWQERGRAHNIELVNYLTNWRQ